MIPTNWPQPLGFALETTLAVTALVVLVLLLRKPVAKRFGAGAAYALWALPLIRLALPPLPSGWNFRSPLSDASGEAVTAAPPAGTETITFVVEAAGAPGAEAAGNWVIPAAAAVPELATTSPINWPLVVATIWGIGAAIALALTVYRHNRFMRVVEAEAEDAGGKLEMMTDDMASEIGLRRRVRVCKSLISSGPMVTGLVRPTILLPTWFEEDYTRNEQRAALAHELTHVKRRDLWALQFAHVAMALQWFNPMAHYALRAFRSDQEAACDADVLRCTSMSPRAYGATLVKAVKLSSPTRAQMMAAGLPLTHAIKDRLVLMQEPQPSLRKKLLGGGMIGLLGACAIVATASAHPPETSIMIENGELTIDGKTYEDRKFILLDDPVHENSFHFEFDGEFEELGELLAKEGEEIAKAFEDMDFSAMVEFEELADLEVLAELEVLQELPEMLSGLVGDIDITTLEDGSMQIVIPKTSINIDAHIEKAEALAEKMAARAEIAIARDEELQARIEEMSARAEEMGERASARAEAFAHKMEMRFAPSTDAVDALANACADKNLEDGEPVIIEQMVEGQNRKLKAVCLKGSGNMSLHLEKVERFIGEHPGLTDVERERIVRRLGEDGRHTSRYRFELRGGSDVPNPPAPPEPDLPPKLED